MVAEHYEANKDVAYHSKKIKEISKRLNWKTTKNGYIQALIDSAATQKTLASEKNVVEFNSLSLKAFVYFSISS